MNRQWMAWILMIAAICTIAGLFAQHFWSRRELKRDETLIAQSKVQIKQSGEQLGQLQKLVDHLTGTVADLASADRAQEAVAGPRAESQIELPAGIQMIWVIFQQPGSLETAKCYRYAYATPEEFVVRIEEFRESARKEGMQLIVTAYSEDRRWVDSEIRYRGEPLESMIPYTCNGRIDYGSKIPLD